MSAPAGSPVDPGYDDDKNRCAYDDDGDLIRSIDGVAVDPNGPYTQVGDIVRSRPGKQVPVVVERNGELVTLTAVLGTRESCGKQGYLGVRPASSEGTIERNPVEGVGAGVKFFGSAAVDTVACANMPGRNESSPSMST